MTEIAGRQTPQAFVHGLSVALEVAAAIAVVGSIVAAAMVRTHVVPEAGRGEPGASVGLDL